MHGRILKSKILELSRAASGASSVKVSILAVGFISPQLLLGTFHGSLVIGDARYFPKLQILSVEISELPVARAIA